MPSTRSLCTASLMVGSLVAASAAAQGLDGRFRGAYVCEKLPITRNILRVPLDLVIREGAAQFARPLFNLNGTRVVGSELASGTVDRDGMLHLTSTWSYLGNIAQGEYSGRLTATGGTLNGTQTWTGAEGMAPVSRTCTIALVPAPKVHGASLPD